MKKIVITLTAAFLAFSCAVNEEGPAKQAKYTIYGTINEEDTRVEIVENGTKFSHHWQDADKISVFNGVSSSSSFEYSVDEGTGTNTASFTGYDQVTENPFYAVYPHNTANAITETDGNPVFTVSFPSEQAYVQYSYDPTANVYVAKGTKSIDANGIDEDVLSFYNTTAYLRLSLYGGDSDNAATVSKIELSTIGGEPIAGTGTVTLIGDEAVVALADVTENSGTFSTVTLAPTEAVTIGATAENATNFFFSVPAVNYGESFQGYQIKIYSGSGDTQTYQWRNVSRALSANVVRKMAALKYNPVATSSTTTLMPAQQFNIAIKTLAGTDCSTSTDPYKTVDKTITRIIFEVNKNMTNIIGTDVSSNSDGSIIASYKNSVIRVQTSASVIKLNDFASIFRNFESLTSIDNLSALNTSDVTSMSYAFMGDKSLTSLDLSGFDTRNVKYAIQMFQSCSSLTNITFGKNCTFGKTTSYSCMFANCISLNNLDLSYFKWEEDNTVRNCYRMFYNCKSIQSITFNHSNPNFTFRYVNDTQGMFNGCENLLSIDLSGVLNVTSSSTKSINMGQMFFNCNSLKTITLNKVSYSRATNISAMFYNCEQLEEINNLDYVTFEAATTMDSLFYGCKSLASADIGKFNTSNCTRMSYMFADCDAIVSLNLSNFDTRNVTSMLYLCNSCDKLESLDISGENCSTAAMTESTALKNMICNNKEIRTLKLGEDFLLGAERFTDGIHYLMLPNPDNLTGVLTIYSSSATATNLLQQVGKPSSNYRAVTAVNNGKLVFKSLDGNVEWKYYSDSALTNEITAAEVTKDSYVGLATSSESSEETSTATNGQAQ